MEINLVKKASVFVMLLVLTAVAGTLAWKGSGPASGDPCRSALIAADAFGCLAAGPRR